MQKKKFLTYEQQIQLLTDKNLIIEDVAFTKQILFKTGYFPLINGYKTLFKDSSTNNFKDGTSINDIYELYLFDNELRCIFIKYILIAERSLKSSLAYHFTDIYGDERKDYLNPKNYDFTGKKVPVIQAMQKIMLGQLRKNSDYAYIRHYMNVYGYVPLWVLMNVLTLGQLSKIYTCQKGRIKIKICNDFGKIKLNELEKMLAIMTKFRNVCAHNDRLFDYSTQDSIPDMVIHKHLQIPRKNDRYQFGKNDLFSQVIILKFLLPDEAFKKFYKDLRKCFSQYPIHKQVLEKMGFSENWMRINRIKKFR